MITSLTVKGYRSLKDVTIPLGPLNVMIGPNGGGKTNIMDVVALLQEGARGNLSNGIADVRRGGIRRLLFAGGAETIEMQVEIPVREGSTQRLGLGTANTLSYGVVLAPVRDGYRVESERIQGNDIRMATSSQQMLSGLLAALSGTAKPTGKNLPAEPKPAELVLSQAETLPVGPLRERAELVRALLGYFASLYRLPDTRPDAPMRLPQVVRPETELKPDSSNLAALLNLLSESDQRRQEYEAIREELQAGFPHEFEDLRFPAAHGEGTIMMRWLEKAFPTHSFDTFEISDGTINFVRLAALIETSGWGTVCIDEPEIGLHPRLIGLVAEMLQAASKRTQFIVATHSPTLVGALKPEEVLVVEKEDGATQVRRLDAEALKEWLKDFSLDELWLTGQLEDAR
jgi:predicted ATPase